MNRTPWIEMDGHPKKLQIYLSVFFSVTNTFGSWTITGALSIVQQLCGNGCQ